MKSYLIMMDDRDSSLKLASLLFNTDDPKWKFIKPSHMFISEDVRVFCKTTKTPESMFRGLSVDGAYISDNVDMETLRNVVMPSLIQKRGFLIETKILRPLKETK